MTDETMTAAGVGPIPAPAPTTNVTTDPAPAHVPAPSAGRPLPTADPSLGYDRCTATLGHALAAGDQYAYVNDTKPVHGTDPLSETPPGTALRVSNPYFLSALAGATCEIQWHETKGVWELIRVANVPSFEPKVPRWWKGSPDMLDELIRMARC